MWQVFEGIKAKNRYPATHIVYRLGNFLLSEPGYFKLFCLILIFCKGDTWQNKMELEIKKAVLAKKIDRAQMVAFRSMVEELYQSEMNKGKIMEFILSEVGPCLINCRGDHCYNDCWIVQEKGERISEKNFDVVFHNDFISLQDLQAEMIESKVDLYTFLFKKPEVPKLPLGRTADSKLVFFNNVREYLCESKICIAFATARVGVEEGLEALRGAGYAWVKVFSGNVIEAMVQEYRHNKIVNG